MGRPKKLVNVEETVENVTVENTTNEEVNTIETLETTETVVLIFSSTQALMNLFTSS